MQQDTQTAPLLLSEIENSAHSAPAEPAAAPAPPAAIPPHLAVLSYKQALLKTVKLFAPITLSRAADMLSGVAATVILARYNQDTMVAAGLIIGTQVPFLFAGSSVLLAGSVLIGKTYGQTIGLRYQNKIAEADALRASIGSMFQQSLLLSIPLSLIPVLLIVNVKPILHLLNQEARYISIVKDFYSSYIYSIPGSMLMSSFRQFAYATNNQWVPLLNGFLDLAILSAPGYFFVNGGAGITAMGAKGMGYAYVIQAYVGLALYFLCFLLSRDIKSFGVFHRHALNRFNHVHSMLKIGWPICINVIGETAVLFASSMIAGTLGKETLSAQLVVGQYMPLTMIPIFAFQQTATIEVAQSKGMRQFVNLQRLGNCNILLGAGFISLFFIATLVAAKQLSLPFMHSTYDHREDVLHLVTSLMPITFTGQIFDAVRNTAIGAMRGYGDTVTPTLMSLSCLWLIGMAIGYPLATQTEMGIDGLVVGYGIGLAIAALLMLTRWVKQTNSFIHSNNDAMLTEYFPGYDTLRNCYQHLFHRRRSIVAPENTSALLEETPAAPEEDTPPQPTV